MPQVAYRKRNEIKIFGLKIIEHFEDYSEHSTDTDDTENKENITLIKRIVEGK